MPRHGNAGRDCIASHARSNATGCQNADFPRHSLQKSQEAHRVLRKGCLMSFIKGGASVAPLCNFTNHPLFYTLSCPQGQMGNWAVQDIGLVNPKLHIGKNMHLLVSQGEGSRPAVARCSLPSGLHKFKQQSPGCFLDF